MAFDQDLAERVRSALGGVPDLETRRMFGGITFMIGGHMACGVVGQELMLRLGPEAAEQALRQPHVRPMDFTGRPSRGAIFVGASGLRNASDLERWISAAMAFVATLPPRRSH
ncbi:MAG TPA: TfoX/Sxy family protein [Candidatus Dormibacteraeota bacterium]|nr:TfoX/Sxy family protein [Candidatus Dormibacteraeota bacterium]